MKSIPLFIGIDLGTTFSAVARLDRAGRPETLFNAEGDRTTPSMVLFDEEDAIVGTEALKAMAVEPHLVAECAKRDIGSAFYHRKIQDQEYPPEVIEAMILDKLRRDAVDRIGPVKYAVVTVPAYFDESRRKATQDAGYMAGLQVIDIINEPTAAALSFAYSRGYSLGNSSDVDPKKHSETLLVYDLGGGTFDVTIMRVEGREFLTLATDGDVELGGRDWDHRILDLVAQQFNDQHGIDFRNDPDAMGRFWLRCEDAKRTLSARSSAKISCDFEGYASRVSITRTEFETATADLLERTRFTMEQTLRQAQLTWADIDCVLPVGGSTRMPMVREMLREVSGREPEMSLSVDEAVAHGAAIHAGQVIARAKGREPELKIRNVNSHSLGVIGNDPATQRPRVGVIIPRNTVIPVRARRTFTTQTVGQKTILVEVVEGESTSPGACIPLGKCTVRDLPSGLPAKTRVDVYFQYNADGRLLVMVDVPGVECRAETQLVHEHELDRDELDRWRQRISGSKPRG